MSDTLTQKALRLLLKGPCPTKEFMEKLLGEDRVNHKRANLLNFVIRMKKTEMMRVLDGKYHITDAGRAIANPDTTVRANTVGKMSGLYSGEELGRTCHRPGAYDFLDVPSLYGSVRKAYKFKSGV